MDSALAQLNKIDLAQENSKSRNTYRPRVRIKTEEDLQYAIKLCNQIKSLSDCAVRVESPWISVYTTTEQDILALASIDEANVKYYSGPPKGVTFVPNTILLPTCAYEYKITVGKTLHENSAFVQWAESNPSKVKLTRRCKHDMLKDSCYGGSYFYLTGDNVLLMAKMHLGSSIAKIERVIKK